MGRTYIGEPRGNLSFWAKDLDPIKDYCKANALSPSKWIMKVCLEKIKNEKKRLKQVASEKAQQQSVKIYA